MKGKQGLIQIYSGDGKGKTTAAAGLALRAAGRDFSVCFAQFLKGRETGEVLAFQKCIPGIRILRFHSGPKFIFQMNEQEKKQARGVLRAGWEQVKTLILENSYDLIVLDEILGVLDMGFVDLDDVLTVLLNKPAQIELVLTGRFAPPKLIESADLVTEMEKIKHPFDEGIQAREGIEF